MAVGGLLAIAGRCLRGVRFGRRSAPPGVHRAAAWRRLCSHRSRRLLTPPPPVAAAAACVGHGVEVARAVRQSPGCGLGLPGSQVPPGDAASHPPAWEGSQAGAWEPEDSRVRKLGLGNAARSLISSRPAWPVRSSCRVRPCRRDQAGSSHAVDIAWLPAGWSTPRPDRASWIRGASPGCIPLPTIPMQLPHRVGPAGCGSVVEDQKRARPSKQGQT